MERTAPESSREDRQEQTHRDAERETDDRRAENDRPPLASLHRSVGNQAVQELHERGELQAKLAVSQPNDRSEREAERVAEAVLAEEDPATERAAVDAVTRQPSGGTDATVDEETESEIRSVTGGGRPLSESERSFFEPRFGRDFSDVRVHTGSQADEAARSINAEAFTLGSDIAFRSGAYRPGTRQGRQLLAHELTHVVQQSGTARRRVGRQQAASGSEHEAASDAAGDEGVGDTAGSVAGITDIVSVLDVSLSTAELASSAATVSQAANLAGMFGALGTLVFGMIEWADALQSQQKLAAVQGASYSLVSIANGREPPGSHDQFGRDGQAAWDRAASEVKQNLEEKIEAGGGEREEAMGSILAAKEKKPLVALNEIYQQLVEENLQDTVLFVFEVGGNLYNLAKSMFLRWPGPDYTSDYSQEQIQKMLSEAAERQ